MPKRRRQTYSPYRNFESKTKDAEQRQRELTLELEQERSLLAASVRNGKLEQQLRAEEDKHYWLENKVRRQKKEIRRLTKIIDNLTNPSQKEDQ